MICFCPFNKSQWGSNNTGPHWLLLYRQKSSKTFFKTSHFVFHRRESHTSLEKTLGWVNDDRIFIFGWSILLKPIQVKSIALLTATISSFMRKRTSRHLIWEQPDEQKSLNQISQCHKPFDVDFLTMRVHQECRIAPYLIGHSNSSCEASGIQT